MTLEQEAQLLEAKRKLSDALNEPFRLANEACRAVADHVENRPMTPDERRKALRELHDVLFSAIDCARGAFEADTEADFRANVAEAREMLEGLVRELKELETA